MTIPADSDAWRRPAATSAERRTDVGIAVGLLVAATLSLALYSVAALYDDPAEPWVTVPWLLAITLPLALRRRFPIRVSLVVAAAFVVGGTLQVSELLVNNIALFLAIYSVGAWSDDRRRAAIARVVIIVGMFVWLLISLFQTATDPDALPGFSRAGLFSPLVAFSLIQILTNVLYFGAAYYFGERAWSAARERAALVERTAELERERERTAEQAVALDRVRIARELHDVVAHHVSVMGIQAAAARVTLDGDPAAARTALGNVEDTSRAAIDDLHSLLATLRGTDGAALEPAASTLSVAGLSELTRESTAAGVPTSLEIVGEPRTVPAVTGVNLYRIAQEALTNVRKHAGPGAVADVRLRYLPAQLELEVSNSGEVAPTPDARGLGQIGMRERVALSGGELTIGPRSRGGYLVRAVVPLAEAPR